MVMLLLLLLSSALPILFIFLFATQRKSRRTPPRPPGPKGLPFIGNLHQIDVSKPHVWLAKVSNKYGPITFLKLCRLPVVVFSSARIAKVVLKDNDVAFAGRPYSSAWSRYSYGQSDIMGAPYTDYWRQMRKIVAHHLFSPNKVRSFRPVLEDEVSCMIAEIAKKADSDKLIDVQEMALSFTCNLLYRVAVGKKFGEGTASWRLFAKIMRQFSVSLGQTFLTDNLLFGWKGKLSGADRGVEKFCVKMDSFYQQLIDDHLSPNRPEFMTKDLLDLLIQLREDESVIRKASYKQPLK